MRLNIIKHLTGFLIAAAALAANPLAAQAATWQTHTFTTDGFAIDFSGNVAVAPMELDADALKLYSRSTTYTQDGGTTVFYISAGFLQNATFNTDKALEAGLKMLNCASVTSDTKIPTPGLDESREVYAKQCIDGTEDVAIAFRVTGNRVYQLIYSIPHGGDATDAEHFLRSFQLVQ